MDSSIQVKPSGSAGWLFSGRVVPNMRLGTSMTVQKILHTADHISTWVGKAAAWLIVVLMLVVWIEVFKRYLLNAPTAWIFDVNNMLYGTLFMLGGAYTLAHDGHVRGDFFTAI